MISISPTRIEQEAEASRFEKTFSSRILSEFPEVSQLKNYESLNFEGNPIRSFQTLPKLQNMKRLIMNQTKISSFYRCLPQPKLSSFSCINTPLSQYEYLNQMAFIVFGERLKRVNGVNLEENEINFGNENRAKILPYLQNGYILTKLDPVTLFHPKSKDTKILNDSQDILKTDSIVTKNSKKPQDHHEQPSQSSKPPESIQIKKEILDHSEKKQSPHRLPRKSTVESYHHHSQPKERNRKPPPPIYTSCFGEEPPKESFEQTSPKHRKSSRDNQKESLLSPSIKDHTETSSPKAKKSSKENHKGSPKHSSPKPTKTNRENPNEESPHTPVNKRRVKRSGQLITSASSPKLHISSSFILEEKPKRTHHEIQEVQLNYEPHSILKKNHTQSTHIKGTDNQKKIFQKQNKNNENSPKKLYKTMSTPSLIFLPIENDFETLELDDGFINPPDEKNEVDSPLVDVSKKEHTDDEIPSLTLTIDSYIEKPKQVRKKSKAPKLSFDPDPITNDEDLLLSGDYSKEDVREAYFNIHKNEITTPEDFEKFYHNLIKKKRHRK